jgi:hypothetical protein
VACVLAAAHPASRALIEELRSESPQISFPVSRIMEHAVSNPEERMESAPAPETSAEGAAPAQRVQIKVDDARAVACYANFCRVTGTPEELIVDFGLNPQPIGVPTEPVVINQRIITNYYTAKRMLHALHLTVQRHEQMFGVLEVDVQKRVVPPARRT